MLEWISLFSSLSKKELDTLSLFCQERDILKWEILFSEWEESSSMYVLKSWLLEAYKSDRVLWQIKPWEFVWEMSLFEWNKLRTASVKALEDSGIIILLAFSIKSLSDNHPEILQKIKEIIVKRKEQNDKTK